MWVIMIISTFMNSFPKAVLISGVEEEETGTKELGA